MNLIDWLAAAGGIAHRASAAAAGFFPGHIRREVHAGRVRVIRRNWLAMADASPDDLAAAGAGGRVACVSAARRRQWWVPGGVDRRLHLHMPPHRSSTVSAGEFDGVLHWTRPIAPVAPSSLIESIEDSLRHIASCLPPEQALVVWESAVRAESLSVDALRLVSWRSRAAADCAQQVTGLSDSGLETIFVFRLRGWGLGIRQQVVLAGKRVDALIGERLVVQIDGFGFHSTSAQRTQDVAHDAELRLRGYTVLRFTYAQIIHEWPAVERIIGRAVAARAHLAAPA